MCNEVTGKVKFHLSPTKSGTSQEKKNILSNINAEIISEIRFSDTDHATYHALKELKVYH